MELSKDKMDGIFERYELATNRIYDIKTEEDVKEPLRDYFQKLAAFLTLVQEVERMIRDGSYSSLSLDELKR